MVEVKEERVGSLDALRIVLCVFVIVLHFNYSHGGAALTYTAGYFYNHEFALLCESFTICAVNGFMILSGYFLGKSQSRVVLKPLLLILTVMGYNSFFCLEEMILNKELSVRAYVHSLIPINYFVWLYAAVYLLSPWFNIVFEYTSKKDGAILLLVMFGLFSAYPSVVDLYSGVTGTTINSISTISSSDSGAGYTFVNFAFMYCIGAYIRKYDLSIKKHHCVLGYIISSGAIYATIHLTINGLYYSNPFVILSALFLFLAFKKSKVQSNRITVTLAEQAFPVFIIHGCMYGLWKAFDLGKILTGSLATAIGAFVLFVSLMYFCSVGVALLGKTVTYPVRSILKRYIRFRYEIQGVKNNGERTHQHNCPLL